MARLMTARIAIGSGDRIGNAKAANGGAKTTADGQNDCDGSEDRGHEKKRVWSAA